LVRKKKLIVDIHVPNLTIEDIKKHISLDTRIQTIKEKWIKETKEAIQELFLGITNFFIEENIAFIVQ